MADEVIGHVSEVVGGDHGVLELVEGVGVDFLDRFDEVIEANRVGATRWFSHTSTVG